MAKSAAIKLKKVSKKYILHHEKPTLMENIFSKKLKQEKWALRDIDLEIDKGESVGLIGSNGSGKTTLLEIIAGITTPTSGEVFTQGKVVSLIDLEAGFHPELTGEENVFINALLMGMSKEEIRKKLKKIISFAELGDFIDVPFYTYSEGMRLRLGFSVVSQTNPDVVLLDENMAVGDQRFREKSLKKIEEFVQAGKTLIIVSHFMDLIKEKCGKVFWLENGQIKEEGESEKVVKNYEKMINK